MALRPPHGRTPLPLLFNVVAGEETYLMPPELKIRMEVYQAAPGARLPTINPGRPQPILSLTGKVAVPL